MRKVLALSFLSECEGPAHRTLHDLYSLFCDWAPETCSYTESTRWLRALMARRGASCCVLGWRGCSCQAQLHTFDTATFRRGYKITTRVAFTMLHSSSVHVADAQAMVSFSGTSQQQISRCQMPGETLTPNSFQCGNAVCAQRRIRGFLQFKKCLSSSQCESY